VPHLAGRIDGRARMDLHFRVAQDRLAMAWSARFAT
jgi:hypothetical protein